MPVVDRQQESGVLQGELWDRARDYAELQESQPHPLFVEAVQRTGLGWGTFVLDLGCGPGGFCRLAADTGANVTGLDISPAMVEIARERVPAVRIDLGDIQSLPYADHSFDVVTAFNSMQFAADPLAAMTEARRVAKPRAAVFVVVFGRPDHVELAAKWQALAALVPARPRGGPGPLALSRPGTLEQLMRQAGLEVTDDGYVEGAFEYPDQVSLLRGQRSAPLAVLAERAAGVAAVNEAILSALAPYRTSCGGYRIENELHYVWARA